MTWRTFLNHIIFTVLLFLLIPAEARAEKGMQNGHVNNAEVANILAILKKSIKLRDYSMLRSYVPKDENLIWDICGSNDASPLELGFDEVVGKLIRMSRGSDIYVHDDVDTFLWNSTDGISMVPIQAEDWNDEYPYLNFLFKFMHKAKRWEWYGVCYDNVPPRVEGRYEPAYKRRPTLPRKGPRTFKDSRNLMVRIEEILKFKALDALVPYALYPDLSFSECKPEMMRNSQMNGKKTPVQVVIDFLKKNDQKGTSEISMTGNREMYLDTKGWSGTYPNISFWFSRGADGWQLSGIVYCKTSLFETTFPGMLK